MLIDNSLLDKLEKLASLKLSSEDRIDAKNQLSEILEFVENLNEIDISNIDATFTTLSGGTQLADDSIVNSNIINDVLKTAPKSSGNFFIVPKIIE